MTVFRPLSRLFAAILVLAGLLTLAACAPPAVTPSSEVAAAAEARLGTQWGEGVESRVSTVDLKRQGGKPLAVHVLRYSAAAGSGAKLVELPIANGRVGLRVLGADGRPWPIYRAGGSAHLQGRSGDQYILEYRNYSRTSTYEIVATVDGLDVLNGQPGGLGNRGYVLKPGATLRIEGFRKSRDEVAAFRFSSVADSYAANSAAGSARNTGVIGTAVFELIDPRPATVPPACGPEPCAFPADQEKNRQGYAPPPRYRN